MSAKSGLFRAAAHKVQVMMGKRAILAAALVMTAALAACASDGDNENQIEGPEIGVNSFLWRASLDTLNFMPLASEDSSGGVIITDWYADPASPGERFKATVYILDTRLRADALNVSIFRQVSVNGVWTDAAVDPATGLQIENAILTKARQLRLSTLAN